MRRRTFLKGSVAVAVLTTLPRLTLATIGENHYQLTAGQSPYRLGPKGSSEARLWLYNGSSPGPAITAEKGDKLTVEFTNQLTQPTTVHWHGIRNLNEMDGVPDVTQAAVEPGESFTYHFPVNDAGTFWYHAHNKTWEQVARGLYGPLIINERSPSGTSDDIVLLADDWRLKDDYQFDYGSLGAMMDWSHQGRLGNWLTINGQTKPTIKVQRNGIARLRLINASNARTLAFDFGERGAEVIALDGAPCKPFSQSVIRFGPAQRVDALIEVGDKNFTLSEISKGQAYAAAEFEVSETTDKIVSKSDLKKLAIWSDFPDISQVKNIDIHMQGGAMGNLSSAIFKGEEKSLRKLAMEHSKFWALNGNIGSNDYTIAEINLGQVVSLNVWNDTSWAHSMHLHGHHFWVNSLEFGENPKLIMRDSYLMKRGEKASLIFVADNPGLWLFHCHMLEHHAAGMGGVIHIY